MGAQEDVMVYWKIIPGAFSFVLIVLAGTSMFDGSSGLMFLTKTQMKADLVAAASTAVHMQPAFTIQIDWDKEKGMFGVTSTESGDGLMLSQRTSYFAVSPFPNQIPLREYIQIDNNYYSNSTGVKKVIIKNNNTYWGLLQ